MNHDAENKNQSGFIALMSAVIICAMLLIIAVTLSASSYFLRFNILDSESKQRSQALAESCINTVLLRLAKNPNDLTIGDVNVENDKCSVVSVQEDMPVLGQATIITRGIYNHAATNLQVVINLNNFSLISWEELPG